MPRILLGVSASVAAYRTLEFIRLASSAGHSIRVIQTPTSQQFVGAASFVALTGAPVLTDEFQLDPARGAFPDQPRPDHDPVSHLELVGNADLYLIAPASANTIAKLAAGLADNLLSSAALAAACPIVLAPAMNNRMYENAATQANLQTLRSRGVHIIDPGVGSLASKGEYGVGRLADPAQLLAVCEAVLHDTPTPRSETWRGLKVLITAGGTREPIDSVRFLGNSSSGRMGFALAQAASERGATVRVLAANVALATPNGVSRRDLHTAAELTQACQEEFPACDVLLMAAAVADFRPVTQATTKIKKTALEHLSVELEPTVDILKALAPLRTATQTLIGFAAEHGEGAISYGREKLVAKGLDGVVVNDISRAEIGFESAENEVTILTAEEERHVSQRPKAEVAEAILDAIDGIRRRRAQQP
jgi:phosphopantothenoylcysteine decarboxylase / phosphopantothenate---cysteine ligase